MRKMLVSIGIIIFLIACKKEEQSQKQLEQNLINENAISQIINLPEGEQKSVYRLLNNHEMAYLWLSKIESFKGAELLSKDQELFINDLLSIIKAELFVINSESNIEFRKIKGKNISASAQRLFGFENAKKLLATLSAFKKKSVTPNVVDPGEEPGTKKCKCSSESNYCDPLAACDEKEESVCKHTTMGCGALWLYSCNGLCRGSE